MPVGDAERFGRRKDRAGEVERWTPSGIDTHDTVMPFHTGWGTEGLRNGFLRGEPCCQR